MVVLRRRPGSKSHALFNRREAAEQSVGLAIGPCREIDLAWISAITSGTDPYGPQTIDDDRLAIGIAQLVDEFATRGIEHINVAVAEVADEQVAGKCAKTRRCHGH